MFALRLPCQMFVENAAEALCRIKRRQPHLAFFAVRGIGASHSVPPRKEGLPPLMMGAHEVIGEGRGGVHPSKLRKIP